MDLTVSMTMGLSGVAPWILGGWRVLSAPAGGGAIWRHNGIIGKISKVYVYLNHEDC
jgi:hypothetical protein